MTTASADTTITEAAAKLTRPTPVFKQIPLALLRQNQNNPRRNVDKRKLDELKVTIRSHGLLQTLLVRPVGGTGEQGCYEVVAGNRRLQALVELNAESPSECKTAACRVEQMTDDEARYAALIENLQREDMHSADVVAAVGDLLSLGHSVALISSRMGWSEKSTQIYARIAAAPEWVQGLLRAVEITVKLKNESGEVQLDPETDKARTETKRCAGLQLRSVLDLSRLHERLKKIDDQNKLAPAYRPCADKLTRKIATQAAEHEWSHPRIVHEIQALFAADAQEKKGKPSASGGTEKNKEKKPFFISDNIIHIDLTLVKSLDATARRVLAAQLHKALIDLGPAVFSSVDIRA